MKSPRPRHIYARVVPAFALLIIFVLTRSIQVTLADNPTVNVLVALAPIDRTSPVELVALTVDANLAESNGHTIVQGNTLFKVHNTDNVDKITLPVGFPEWAGGALSFDPSQFSEFDVTLDGKKISFTPTNAPVKIGSELRPVNWYSFDLTLDPDEKKVVSVDFIQDLGTDIFPRFTYGLLPSNGWKGAIGSARLTLHLPAPTTGEQFIALDPSVPDFNGEELSWLWVDFNPNADPGVTLIRPSLWADLLNKRAAAVQNPDNGGLHLALGRVYQQLAAEESARRDNFLAQAIAELETAARLDPKNVDAVTQLAQLYENRAGPAGGPRDENYVALALAQWQNLIGTRADAVGRKQSAEDSFYLGISARSRGENEQALKFFEDAANFSPRGAGPLYTPEHFATEMQAVQIALARAAEQQDEIATALAHARAAFGKDFDLTPAPPVPSFALDRALVDTTTAERRIVLNLVAYPGPSDQARQAVDGVVAGLNQTGGGSAAQVATESDYGLLITVPFNSDKDLENRLTRLARGFPAREDWDVVRAVVDSPAIAWSEQTDAFTHAMHYREEVDLASAQEPLQSNLNELSKAIGTLDTAPTQDDRAQLRLGLLRDAQEWWQHKLATGSATFVFEPGDTPVRQWNVKLGEKQTLTYEDAEVRPEWYLIGGLSGLAAFLLLVLIVGLIRTRRRRQVRANEA